MYRPLTNPRFTYDSYKIIKTSVPSDQTFQISKGHLYKIYMEKPMSSIQAIRYLNTI